MRTDVKLGVVVAMVVVTVAGGYYMYRDRAQQPIIIAGQSGEAASNGTAPDTPGSAVPQNTSARSASPRSKPAKKTLVQNTPTRESPTQGTKPQRAPQRLNQPGEARTPASTPQTTPGTRLADRVPRGGTTPSDAVQRAQEKRRAQQLALQHQQDAQAPNSLDNAAAPKLPPVGLPLTPVASAPGKTVGPKSVPLTAATPSTAAVEKHRVQPGDTLSSLAVQYYGSERHTRLLIDANKQLGDPDRLKIGEVVNLPPAPVATQAPGSALKPASHGARSYTVRSGDSFYVIAQSQLGDASRWNELYELNRAVVGSDPASLKVGQVLMLPSK